MFVGVVPLGECSIMVHVDVYPPINRINENIIPFSAFSKKNLAIFCLQTLFLRTRVYVA